MYQPGRPPIPYLLAYAGTLAVSRADQALRSYGLTVRQFGLLAQLHLEPELTMSELARQLGVSRQALYDLVGELERAGHLTRLPGATGRTRRLALAPGTEYLLTRAQRALTEVEAGLVGGLNPRAAEALRGLLQHLLAQATDDETWLAGL